MTYFISILLMVLSSLLAGFGQICLKMGSMELDRNIMKLIKNYVLILGIIFYGLSSVITIIALKGNELTVLYPIASLNYVWVSLLSMKFLKEKMNAYKWAGIVTIVVGVTIII